jgi:hypothetical protein
MVRFFGHGTYWETTPLVAFLVRGRLARAFLAGCSADFVIDFRFGGMSSAKPVLECFGLEIFLTLPRF